MWVPITCINPLSASYVYRRSGSVLYKHAYIEIYILPETDDDVNLWYSLKVATAQWGDGGGIVAFTSTIPEHKTLKTAGTQRVDTHLTSGKTFWKSAKLTYIAFLYFELKITTHKAATV